MFLSLQGVTKRFGSVVAVDHVDLDLSETGLEREPADAFGLARFGDFELLLQSGDVFLDLR